MELVLHNYQRGHLLKISFTYAQKLTDAPKQSLNNK